MPSRVVQVATAQGSDHTNTTTENRIARKAFAADELQVGQVWDFACAYVADATNSTDTLACGVRFGTSSTPTSNTAIGASAAVDVANADFGVVKGRLVVASLTRLVIYGELSAPDDANTQKMCAFYNTFTWAVGTAYNLDITCDWSVASASNTVAAADFHCIRVV